MTSIHQRCRIPASRAGWSSIDRNSHSEASGISVVLVGSTPDLGVQEGLATSPALDRRMFEPSVARF
jgi:hypothetical protein